MEASVSKQVEIKAPLVVDKEMRQKIGALLRDHKGYLMEVIQETQQLKQFRERKKILAVCDKGEDAELMEDFLKNTMQFKRVKAEIYREDLEMDRYDLVLLCQPPVAGNQWENLNEQAIEKITEEEGHYLYFGPGRFSFLNQKDCISCANKFITLSSRLIEHLQYIELQSSKL